MEVQKFILKYEAEEETLTQNPDGWDRNGQSWHRDKIYHGVFQSYTVETFRFGRLSGQGGDFIKEKYDIDDIKTVIEVEVYDRNPQTDDYDLSYTGLLNFDPEKFTIEREYVEIGFISNGDIQNFIVNDEIELDINSRYSLNNTLMNAFSNAPASILFKGINLYLTVEQSGVFTDVIFFGDYGGYNLDEKDIYYYANNVTINEIGDRLQTEFGPAAIDRTAEIYTNDTDFETELTFADPEEASNNSYISFQDNAINAHGEINIYIKIEIYDSDDILIDQLFVDQHNIVFDHGDPQTIYITYDFDALIDYVASVPSGGYVYFITRGIPIVGTWQSTYCNLDQKVTNKLNFIEKSPTIGDTNNEAFFPHELYTRIFQQILSKENGFYSEFFGRTDSEFITYLANGEGSLDAIISGWNLRQFPDRQFIVKLRDMFQTHDAMYNLMMGYDFDNERFYIEEKAQAYRGDLAMIDLGEVDELKITPYKDAYSNKIEAGYDEKGDYEDFQGIYEPNLNQNYSIDMPIKENLSIRAPYNTDSIGMELTRRKPYSDYASEDTKGDEKIYIVRTDGSETIQGATNASGFIGIDERYNLALTPRENVIRWAGFLKAGLWKEGTINIKFQSATKSVNIIYENQNGDTVNEFDNIADADLPDLRLFNPQYYQFKSVFDLEKMAQLYENPHRLVKFDFNGEHLVGFVDEIVTEDYNRKASYKLIAYDSIEGETKLFMDDDDALFMDDDTHELL